MRRRVGWVCKSRILAVIAGAAIVGGIAVTAAFGAHRATPGRHAPRRSRSAARSRSPGRRRSTRRFPQRRRRTSTTSTITAASTGGRSTSRSSTTAYDPSKTVPLDAAARRAGQGVRGLRQPRHRAEPRHLGLPEQPQGAAGPRRDRRLLLGLLGTRSTRGRSAGSPTTRARRKVYGKYIAANMPNAKIGVLYQNDAFGKNYYAGLRVGLGAKKSNIVDAESYDVDERRALTQQILALKSKGADTLVVFATPIADDQRARDRDEGRLDAQRDVHRQRLGEPALPAGRRGERRERRRRHLVGLLPSSSTTAAEHCRGSSSRRRSSRSTRRRSRRASPTADGTSSTASAPPGRSSTRSSTPARIRRGRA